MSAQPDEGNFGKAYTADEITVYYERARCRHYAECVRGLPDVFDPSRRPWIRADLADRERIAEVVRSCPTGALHYRLASGETERPLEPTSIHRDPRRAVARQRRPRPRYAGRNDP